MLCDGRSHAARARDALWCQLRGRAVCERMCRVRENAVEETAVGENFWESGSRHTIVTMLYDSIPDPRTDAPRALEALRALLFLRRAKRALGRRKQVPRTKRGPRPARVPAITWEELMAKTVLRNNPAIFKQMFRMDRTQFEKLAVALDTKWEQTRKTGRTGAPRKVETRVALGMTLRYIAGGAPVDICMLYNVPIGTFRNTFKRTIETLYHVLPAWELLGALDDAVYAGKPERLERIREGFAKKGRGYFEGVIGAIDGLLIPIEAQDDRPNARDFYCRKGFHALNCQAIADTDGRITYATIGSVPGCAHDSYSWAQDSMCGKLRDADHPICKYLKGRRYHLLGDDAYACSHTLATPWPGSHASDAPELAYNQCHASLRACIERAFGMLSRKWLCVKRPFAAHSIRRTKEAPGVHVIVVVCMKLHNMVINAGDAGSAHVYEPDVQGVRDPMCGGDADAEVRGDARGRAQGLSLATAHLASENEVLRRVEAANGDGEAARDAALPAWDNDRSWRDPAHGKDTTKFGEGMKGKKPIVCSPRHYATELMGEHGLRRRGAVHWK